jgi:hypothetical protein
MLLLVIVSTIFGIVTTSIIYNCSRSDKSKYTSDEIDYTDDIIMNELIPMSY